MRQVHNMTVPAKNIISKKKEVRTVYVEADEDHIAPQYKNKKGDIKRYQGHADNGQIVKLVYVHEGCADMGKNRSRKELKNAVYFGGLYKGKENEMLWKEVKEYIETQYKTEGMETIYFQSDGGGWMKKGIETLGVEFVLDEFHIWKYLRKMVSLANGNKKEEREETEGMDRNMKVPEDFSLKNNIFIEECDKEYLKWISPDDEQTIYPDFFRTELIHPKNTVQYFITDER